MQRVLSSLASLASLEAVRAQGLPPCTELPTSVPLPAPHSHFYMADNLTYLNVGSLGPSPRASVDCAMLQWTWLEANKVSRYSWSGGIPETVRAMAADMLGENISLDELAHFPSTTSALNAVANGLASSGFLSAANWSSGQPPRVLTTDQEHAGGVAAWQHYVRAGMLSGLDTVAVGAPPASVDTVVADFAAALGAVPNRTYAVLCVSHVLTTTGLRLPLPRLAALARAHGALLVVDGAQAPGNIDVRLDLTGADAYTVSAHKCTPLPASGEPCPHAMPDVCFGERQGCWRRQAAGCCTCATRHGPSSSPRISTVVLARVRFRRTPDVCPHSVGASLIPCAPDTLPVADTACTGTTPLQTLAGLGYSLAYIGGMGGLPALAGHNARLYARSYALLLREPRVTMLSAPPGSGLESALLSFAIACNATNSAVAHALSTEHAIVVKTLPDGEGGTPLVRNALRISHHAFNSEVQMESFAWALSLVLSSMNCSMPDASVQM